MVVINNPDQDKDIQKAMNLIKNEKIARIDDKIMKNAFVVTGTHDDYLVLPPNYCTCEQFILRCLKTPGSICYHLLAVKMASEITKVSDENWKDLLFRVR